MLHDSQQRRWFLRLSGFLNSLDFKKRFPESGEDIKVMGLRENNKLNLTIADPLIDMFIESESHYFRKRKNCWRNKNLCYERTEFEPSISLNTLDREGRGMGGIYITVTGLLPRMRIQARWGAEIVWMASFHWTGRLAAKQPREKPVSHVGKIYNVLSHRIANEIYVNVPDIKEVYVWLLSR